MRKGWLLPQVGLTVALLLGLACTNTSPTPTATPSLVPTSSPNPSVTREWDLEGIQVDGSTVTVLLHVYAGIDVGVTLDSRDPDQVNAPNPILEFVFQNVAAGKHDILISDVVGFKESADVVVAHQVPSDWQTAGVSHGERGFSLSLPPGWQLNEFQGIDSYVGEIVAEGVRLEYDLGWYSSSLVDDDDPAHIVTYEDIGGRRAKLVRPKEGTEGLVGVYIEDFHGGGSESLPSFRLQISGRGLTPEQQETSFTIFRSIRGPNGEHRGSRSDTVGTGEVGSVTFDELFSRPEEYNGSEVVLTGFYFHGWETTVLSERLEYTGRAEGHLWPQGRMVWIEDNPVPRDIYDRLYQQELIGPLERYGKLRIKGMFEHGGRYGHGGGLIAQIVPSEAELLSWSPPREQRLARHDYPSSSFATTPVTSAIGTSSESAALRPLTSTEPWRRLRGLTTRRTGSPSRSASLNFTPAASSSRSS